MQEITYEELRSKIETEIRAKFGGVASFINNKEQFEAAGFSESDKRNLIQYLSVPSDRKNVVQSFPAMSKLHSHLFGVKVTRVTKVARTSQIFIAQ